MFNSATSIQNSTKYIFHRAVLDYLLYLFVCCRLAIGLEQLCTFQIFVTQWKGGSCRRYTRQTWMCFLRMAGRCTASPILSTGRASIQRWTHCAPGYRRPGGVLTETWRPAAQPSPPLGGLQSSSRRLYALAYVAF
jgi:hypothetical protein